MGGLSAKKTLLPRPTFKTCKNLNHSLKIKQRAKAQNSLQKQLKNNITEPQENQSTNYNRTLLS